MSREQNPIRPTTPEAVKLAKTLLRAARYGALAVLDAGGWPLASRVATATDTDGSPVLLVSDLAAHTAAMVAHPACSLLLGEPGKGDPLAHARVTIRCRAEKIGRDAPDYARLRRRYLNHNPKGALYVDLGGFDFFRLGVESVSLNGGFGAAFALTPADLLAPSTVTDAFAAQEQATLDAVNADPEALAALVTAAGEKDAGGAWRMIGLDPDGADFASGDRVVRLHFPSSCDSVQTAAQILENAAQKGA